MEYTSDFLSNKLFLDNPLASSVSLGERIGSTHVKTGLFYQANGDVKILVYAPRISEVSVHINRIPHAFTRCNDGFFEIVLQRDPNIIGPMNADLFFDGTRIVYPTIPAYWSANSIHNYIEFPGEELSFSFMKDVPHGCISRHYFWSNEFNDYERCLVYTPPGYMTGTVSYPVLYLQHGMGENETVWESTGKVANIMDNLIASKQCEPFIIVMNNNMLRYPGNEGGGIDRGFENMLLHDCIPFIEQTFRVKTGKWNRAICGLSMGSYLSNDIAIFHPETFGYVGALTGCMYHTDPKLAVYERPYLEAMKTGNVFKEHYRVFYQSATPQEDHLDFCMVDNQICKDCGVADMPGYRFIVHPANYPRWASWRTGLRDFAKLIFRPEEAYATREKFKETCGI